MSDVMKNQVGGNHYKKHNIQPWHIIDEYQLDYYKGNVLKYLLRDKGNEREDLQKAIHYLEKRIDMLKEHVGQTRLSFEEDYIGAIEEDGY